MAVFEHRLGVEATFYLMGRSPYYNAASWEGQRAIGRIRALGHDVGIHVDLDAARDSRPFAVWAAIEAERHLLGIGPTRKVSFHCPPAALLWADVPGYDSAYAPGWKDRYYSDSSGRFAFGDPEDHDGGPIQVNLHPEHWWGGMPPEGDRPGFWR